MTSTFKHLKQYRTLFLFLLAFLLYNDGVETVIAMAGSFGTDYLKMTDEKLIVMFLIVQFVAFFGAVVLTAFNDNAAITFLAALVPDLSDAMKYAVVAGAVTGGGLTVIANAPNPAGQAILAKHFEDGVLPLGLLLGALVPTIVAATMFLVFR